MNVHPADVELFLADRPRIMAKLMVAFLQVLVVDAPKVDVPL
jgi:hypothetical protein